MTFALSTDADALLHRAQHAEHAVDLYLAPGATRLVADRIAEILHRAPLAQLNERALWNTLFAAGELSLRVDVYRAHDLFRAAVALVQRSGGLALPPGDPRAVAVEMTFDFFFARNAHPLLPLRAHDVVAALVTLLDGDRVARRAALHGLGHLVALARNAGYAALESEASAALDEVARSRDAGVLDLGVAELADAARAGTLE
jgi:hypothetical protein